jgi:hypothetical protein
VHYAHGRIYCSLLTNEFSTKGLRAYGRRFGGNGASKHTKSYLFHRRISTLLYRLVIIKILSLGKVGPFAKVACIRDLGKGLYRVKG